MVFVSWISHNRRSQLIADKFGMKLYLVQSLKRRYLFAPIRYILQAVRTFRILRLEKPAVVFVMNPPIFASLIVFLYAKLYNKKFIIDSHTFALLAWWWRWSLPLHRFLSRRAITTVVTNTHLESMIKGWRANAFIIGDIPNIFPEGKVFSVSKDKFNVAVINSFAPDEPLESILKSAISLPEVQFYITGDTIRAKESHLGNHPPNVRFTGFLPDEEYFGLLRGVEAIMVLTTDDHTMQRGACEAVSLGKPIITSDWPLLREYFNKGTIHVDNTVRGIRNGIIKMQRTRDFLGKEILFMQRERWQEWNEKEVRLRKLINDNLSKGTGIR